MSGVSRIAPGADSHEVLMNVPDRIPKNSRLTYIRVCVCVYLSWESAKMSDGKWSKQQKLAETTVVVHIPGVHSIMTFVVIPYIHIIVSSSRVRRHALLREPYRFLGGWCRRCRRFGGGCRRFGGGRWFRGCRGFRGYRLFGAGHRRGFHLPRPRLGCIFVVHESVKCNIILQQ